jgi:cysteine-rich secretory family protein
MAFCKRLALVVSSALVVLGLVAGPASADEVGDEQRFVQLINQSRGEAGLPPLSIDAQLVSGARIHSVEMAQQGTIFHNPGLAASVPDNWTRLGENVGMGGGVDTLHQAFMNSPGHRANVLGDYDRVGIGITMLGSVVFVTEVFWKTAAVLESPPAPAPPPAVAASPASAAAAQASAPAAHQPAPPAAPVIKATTPPATSKVVVAKKKTKTRKAKARPTARRSARRHRRR